MISSSSTFQVLPGEQNTVADALSRLPSQEAPVAAATKLSITVEEGQGSPGGES